MHHSLKSNSESVNVKVLTKLKDKDMKKKTTSIIEEQLQRLNRSPLFAISLSGKELSHSNFWAWLLEQETKGKHPFIEVFIPDFYQNGCTFISVEREKMHVDLTITYKNKANETEVLIIENKIKSIPTKEQLMRYEEELGKQELPITGILTGLYALLDIQELGKWSFLSYQEIATRIQNIQQQHATMDFADYIKQYAEDIEVLYALFQSKMEQNKGKYIIGDKDLEKIRYSDIYVKLKGSEFMEEINKRLTFGAYKDWAKPVCGFSFNNKKPTLSIVFSQRINEDPTKEIGMIGVQIEGDQFRIYGGASQEGNYHEKVVIEKLYECDYFKRNFAEEIVKQNRTSKMRNNYCKYGKVVDKYCHCYQHWKIEDFSHDAIIDELIKQMKIAEEKIKGGLTFGE